MSIKNSSEKLKIGQIRLFGHYEIPAIVVDYNDVHKSYVVIDQTGDLDMFSYGENLKLTRNLNPNLRELLIKCCKVYRKKMSLLLELEQTEGELEEVRGELYYLEK